MIAATGARTAGRAAGFGASRDVPSDPSAEMGRSGDLSNQRGVLIMRLFAKLPQDDAGAKPYRRRRR